MCILRNWTWPWLVAYCLLTLVAAAVRAQGESPRNDSKARASGPGQEAAVPLLVMEQVQKELQMTPAQIEKVWKLEEAWVAGFRDLRDLSSSPPGELDKRLADRQKKHAEINQQAHELLTAEQSSRLRQIRLWMGGVAILATDGEAAKDLKLSETQGDKLRSIVAEFSKQTLDLRRELPKAKPEDRPKISQQINALPNETEIACRAVLSDEQMARFEELRGPKFEFDNEALRRDRQKSRERARERKQAQSQ